MFLDFFDVVLGERGRCSAHGDLQGGKGGEIGWWLTSTGARKTVSLPFEEKSGTSARFKAPAEDSVSSGLQHTNPLRPVTPNRVDNIDIG